MLLFTPLDNDAALSAVEGLGYPDGEFHFITYPERDEAYTDAVWVAIEVSEVDVKAYKYAVHSGLGYRAFALPGPVASRYATRFLDPR